MHIMRMDDNADMPRGLLRLAYPPLRQPPRIPTNPKFSQLVWQALRFANALVIIVVLIVITLQQTECKCGCRFISELSA